MNNSNYDSRIRGKFYIAGDRYQFLKELEAKCKEERAAGKHRRSKDKAAPIKR